MSFKSRARSCSPWPCWFCCPSRLRSSGPRLPRRKGSTLRPPDQSRDPGRPGKPVQDGKPAANANPAVGSPCQYVVGDFGAFSILVKATGPGETPDAVQAGLKRSNIKTADAPGIGDRSFFSFPGYGMVQLNTFKGASMSS